VPRSSSSVPLPFITPSRSPAPPSALHPFGHAADSSVDAFSLNLVEQSQNPGLLVDGFVKSETQFWSTAKTES
jgi:hypothetical protein